jgi:hypothetical protein
MTQPGIDVRTLAFLIERSLSRAVDRGAWCSRVQAATSL